MQYSIYKRTNGKSEYLYMFKSHRDEENKLKRVIIAKLGSYQDFVSKHNSPESFRSFLDTLEYKFDEQDKIDITNFYIKKFLNNATSYTELLKSQKVNENVLALNYGNVVINHVLRDFLELGAFVKNKQNTKSYAKIKFNIFDALNYLVTSRIIAPGSVKAAAENSTTYLCDPMGNLELHDMYNSLAPINSMKNSIFRHINHVVKNKIGRDYSIVFFDLTNFYFESDKNDKEKLNKKIFNMIQSLTEDYDSQCDSLGAHPDKVSLYDYISNNLKRFLDSQDLLKMHGKSKEQRTDLPLCTVALVIDSNALIVDMKIFSGNTSEFSTIDPMIKEIQAIYGVASFIFVADRGINSLQNLYNLYHGGMGFIVAQKVTNLKQDKHLEMRDFDKYLDYPSQDINEESHSESYNAKEYNQITKGLIRPIQSDKKIIDLINNYVASAPRKSCYRIVDYLREFKQDEESAVLECDLVFNFSPTRFKHDLVSIIKDINDAVLAISKGTSIKRAKTSGWQGLVKLGKAVDAEGQNIFKAEVISIEKIEKRLSTAGIAAVVYKKAKSQTEDLSDQEILDSYRKLVRIEECFRDLKSNLELRPVFLSKRDHISAHCLICSIALIVLRIIQIKLGERGQHYTIKKIMEALRNADILAHSKDGTNGYFSMPTSSKQKVKMLSISTSRNKQEAMAKEIEVFNDNQGKVLLDEILEVFNLAIPKQDKIDPYELFKGLKLSKRGYLSMIGEELSAWQRNYCEGNYNNIEDNIAF